MSDEKIHIFKTGIYYEEVRYYILIAAVKMRLYSYKNDWLFHGMKKGFSYYDGETLIFNNFNMEYFDDTIFSDVHIASDGEMYIVAKEDPYINTLVTSGKYFNRVGLCMNLERLSDDYEMLCKADEFLNGKIRDCCHYPPSLAFHSVRMAILDNDIPLGHPICNPFAQALITEKQKELQNKVKDVFDSDISLLYEKYVIKDLNDTYHEMVSIVSKELEE